VRLIARLDVKNNFVIKGIQMEGLRKLGDPLDFAKRYYADGVDELMFIDCVASLYGRNNLFATIERACKEVFIPLTVGGGIRTVEDVEQALSSGADKVAINTAAMRSPSFITEISKRYGSQCVVASVQAKQVGGIWQAYVEAGREPSGKDVIEWLRILQDLGAGEVLLTSVDRDGTRKGFDVELIQRANAAIRLPLVASGGCGQLQHLRDLLAVTKPSAVALSSVLHYKAIQVPDLRRELGGDE
jgi:imidazole glycerol-phosphate synthase subunit HisF